MTGLQVASVLQFLVGLGFGIPGVIGTLHVARGRGIWTFMGFPTYGKGPFEQVGLPTTVPLMTAFLLVLAAECVAAWLLWSGNRTGAFLSLALLPLAATFWWGFALPIPPILAVVWTVLILVNWQLLR